MKTLHNATTGQSVEWAGTLEEFNAASDADQVGQWTSEAVAAPAPAEVPVAEVAA